MEALDSILSGWLSAALGGLLVGLSGVGLLVLHGRVAGISGLLASSLFGPREGVKVGFVVGLVASGLLLVSLSAERFAVPEARSLLWVLVSGVLVGWGTQLGNGCTSGHGVCGLSRLSARSLVATLLFTVFGAVSVAVVRIVFGGVL